MSSRRPVSQWIVAAACVLGIFVLTSSIAHAQQYWDTNGAAGGLGGTGNWDLTLANWNNSSGTGAPQVWANLTTSDAVLDGTAGTVTLTTTGIVAHNLNFNLANYIIADTAGTFTLYGSINFFENDKIDSGAGSGKTVLAGAASNVTWIPRDRNSIDATIAGKLDLNATRVPTRIFRTGSINETSPPLNGLEIDRPIFITATVTDGASTGGILKTGAGSINLDGANTYSGGTTVIEGRVNVTTAAGRLGANVSTNNVVVDGGALNLSNAANIGSNQSLTVNSKAYRLGVLGVGFNSVPTFSTSTDGVLAINTNTFTAVTNMATVGNGRWFLGSSSGGTFTGATLGAGLDNTYRLGGGSGSFTGGTLTITNGVLTGSNNVIVGSARLNGTSQLTLQGNNGYTGTTTLNSSGQNYDTVGLTLSTATGAIASSSGVTVNRSTLTLDSSGANNNNRLGNSAPVTMNSGEFALKGNASAATTEDYGNLVISSARPIVTVTPAAGGASTLLGDALLRSFGADVLFRGNSLGSAPGANVANITFSSAPTLAGNSTLGGTDAGILPYALADSTNGGSGTSFATYGANGIRTLTGAESTATVTAGQNVRLVAGASSSTTSLNSLELNGTTTLSGTAAANDTLTVTSGGILSTGSNNTIDATMEKLTFGNNAVTGYEGNIHTVAPLTINSAIVDNGANAVSLTKTGPSSLTLGGVNTFSGKLAITNGGLIFTNANQLGSPSAGNETIELNGSFAFLGTSSSVLTRAIHLTGSSQISTFNALWTLNGAISGNNVTLAMFTNQGGIPIAVNGPIDLGSEGALVHIGFGALTLGSASSNYGLLAIETNRTDVVGQNIVKLGVDNAVPTAAALSVYMGEFDLNGHQQTVANLTDDPRLLGHNTATQGNHGILNNSTGTGTLTVNNAGANAFGGDVKGTNFNLMKNNTGELTLYGNNTYGGNTTVLNGKLTVQTSLANNGSSKIFMALDPDGNFSNGGPALSRATEAGANYAGFGSQVTSGLLTKADILAGTNITGTDVFTTMMWRSRASNTATLPPQEVLVSEILGLTDMNNAIGSDQSDAFVLQMTYDSAYLNPAREAEAISDSRLYIASILGGAWTNAVNANFGNNASLVQQNYVGTFASFQTLYGTTLTSYMGAWGIDTANDRAWAVLNHNTDFAVLAPEPAMAGVMAMGVVLMLKRRCRH